MRKARMIVLACCLACISLPGRVNAQFFDRSYAIVIGIDHYEFANTWPTLSYAVKDAQAMAGLLRGQGFTVIPLYETQANKQAILSSMQDNLAPGSVLVIAYWCFLPATGRPRSWEGKSGATLSRMTATTAPA